MDPYYLDAIRNSEGFTPTARWDYRRNSNGYGTRALYPGEEISRDEADSRFQGEIAKARSIVDRFAPNVDEGTKAALTSLTYNAGDDWTRSGLGDAVRTGDMDKARSLFLQYTKAGGQQLPGLVSRRAAEAQWMGGGQPAAGLAALPGIRSGSQTALLPSPARPAARPEDNVLDFLRATKTAPIQLADNTGAAQRVVDNYLRMAARNG